MDRERTGIVASADVKGEAETGSSIVDRFSLIQGGPIYRLQMALHMAMPDRSGVSKRALIAVLISWLPLLVLSAIQGQAWGTGVRIPFLYDISVNVRSLIALPLLVFAEAMIDPRINHCVRYFVTSGLIDAAELPAFERVIQRTMRLRDTLLPTVLILVASFAPSFWFQTTELMAKGPTSWLGVATPSGEVLSLAGWWLGLVSLPIYRILLFRWIWAITLWAVFLRGASKLNLGCVATHPDTAGGLEFLTHAQLFFGVIAFSGSAVVAGAFGNLIAYEGQTVSSLKIEIIVFCLFAVILIAAPLLVVTPKLMKVKERGMHEYGAFGTAYAQSFDAKWIAPGGRPAPENLLGTADISGLAGLANGFAVVRAMKVLLINKEVLIGLAVPVIVPMIPLFLMATPTDQLVHVLKMLL